MQPVRLRVHHLLCFFGWRGVGYSPEFTQTFSSLRESLNWSTPVTLTLNYDAICCSCPKKSTVNCLSKPGTVPYTIDRRLLSQLALKEEETYPLSVLLEKVVKLVPPEILNDICSGCYWVNLGWCEQGLKEKQFYESKKRLAKL